MITWADITPTLLDIAGATPEDASFHGRSFAAAMQEESPAGWVEIFASHAFHKVTMYYPMRVVRSRRRKLIWNIAHGLPFPFASDLWASETWRAVLEGTLPRYGQRMVDRYIHRAPFELYDLERDPHEVNNLVDDPASGPLLKTLKARLRTFQETTADPWIVKWTYE